MTMMWLPNKLSQIMGFPRSLGERVCYNLLAAVAYTVSVVFMLAMLCVVLEIVFWPVHLAFKTGCWWWLLAMVPWGCIIKAVYDWAME